MLLRTGGVSPPSRVAECQKAGPLFKNFNFSQAMSVNKFTWIAIGSTVLFSFYCYLVHVGEKYRNGMGEKLAVILANAIIESSKEGNDSLEVFLKKSSHFYSDQRGNPYEINVEGNRKFEISYKPKPSWVSRILHGRPQELKINWVSGEEMHIQSSIEKP